MQYRRLGASGLKVSEVCLGSWLTFGNATEDLTAVQCIEKAYELGINFLPATVTYTWEEAKRRRECRKSKCDRPANRQQEAVGDSGSRKQRGGRPSPRIVALVGPKMKARSRVEV